MGKDLFNYKLRDASLEIAPQVENFNKGVQEEVRSYHRSFLDYEASPLHSLDELAGHLGLDKIYIKDESHRFGLKAFKVLGVSYALARILAERLGEEAGELSFDYFSSPEVKERLGQLVFVTATDGNHGRALAWAANRLGQSSVVYMPRNSSSYRLEAIRKEGARAEIIDGNYDDAVRLSQEMAKKEGWIVVQDTSWPGYDKIPLWIMQGYTTILAEILEELFNKEISHVFLQAGVGSFAGAILAGLVAVKKENLPRIYLIEPDKADCYYRSALRGELSHVGGDMDTLMAGLACGEPNPFSYELIKGYSSGYFSCDDSLAVLGMRILAFPLEGDPAFVGGESGALGPGLLYRIARDQEHEGLRQAMGLDSSSRVLFISTEGDTDPEVYRKILWGL